MGEINPSPDRVANTGFGQVFSSGEAGYEALLGTGGISIYRALVTDVIYDTADTPADDDEKFLEHLDEKKIPVAYYENAPRNSIMFQFLESTAGVDDTEYIAYPFFPSHFAMPVKAGENVWVLCRRGEKEPIVYWLCRVTESDIAEDANFTFHEHRHNEVPGKLDKDAAAKIDSISGDEDAPTKVGDHIKTPAVGASGVPRPNEDEDEIYSQPLPGSTDEKGMETIILESRTNHAVMREPVPRFTKRPGDMVLQGSNNTLICLGTDRGWTAEKRPKPADAKASNAYFNPDDEGKNPQTEEPMPDFTGTIDIVVGRGRFPKEMPAAGDAPKETEPLMVEDSEKTLQVDKNPQATEKGTTDANRLENPTEGDPDFMRDASRVYISQATHGDLNFGTKEAANNKFKVPKPDDKDNVGVDVEPIPADLKDPGEPYVIMKSDHIRIIARQDKDEKIDGSITIIKEGKPDDNKGKPGESGRAIITLRPDGTIYIDGPKVVIGSGADSINSKPGEGSQVSFGLDAKEPIHRGLMLEKAILDCLKELHKDTTTPSDSLMAPLVLPLWPAAIAKLEKDLEAARSTVVKTK